MSEVASTKELKRVLGRKELLSIGIGQTIGSGIFAMVGIGIAMTGRSASISMLIAAIFTILYCRRCHVRTVHNPELCTWLGYKTDPAGSS